MRVKISREDETKIQSIFKYFHFKSETVIARIAFAFSLQNNEKFDIDAIYNNGNDFKDFRDDKVLFGTLANSESNLPVYKSILDVYYEKSLSNDEFINLFKLHMNHGLNLIDNELKNTNVSKGGHFDILAKMLKKGLDFHKSTINYPIENQKLNSNLKSVSGLISFELGILEDGTPLVIRINDLHEFDNRNIAIAGMAGSGKTQLIKDILYQLSKNTNSDLKFIFFDYKGEGNKDQLDSFLKKTDSEFIDIVQESLSFNPFQAINTNERQKLFSIKAFVDTIATFVPNMGISQKGVLQTIIEEMFENFDGTNLPNMNDLFKKIEDYYVIKKIKPDSLYSIIKDLSSNLFKNSSNINFFDKSIYLNLLPTLSDTLRQLIVFLLLRYFNVYFSSLNDVEPNENIIPLRYVIVIDEAHIYLKNKNARKALEELLRLLRSKGVVVVMLTQGVEDFKTKDFDFSSQVKLPICLNVQNKDPKVLKSFLGTPKNIYKFETAISKLNSGLGLVNLSEPQVIELRQFWKTIK